MTEPAWDYEITRDDGGASSIAKRFGVSEAALRTRNRGSHFAAGEKIFIPFVHNPHDGLEYYEFDYAAHPLNIYAVTNAGVRTPEQQALFQNMPLWNKKLRYDADALWKHYGNRIFRAWQLRHGGSVDDLRAERDGERSPPLWLPYAKPAVQPPTKVTPTACSNGNTAPPCVNPVQVAVEHVQKIFELVAKLKELQRLFHWVRESNIRCTKDAQSVVTVARAMSGLADMLEAQCSWVDDVESTAAWRRGHMGKLKTKTAELYNRIIEREIPPHAPLQKLAPDIADGPDEYGARLVALLQDPANIRLLDEYFKSALGTAQQKADVRLILAAHLDGVFAQGQHTKHLATLDRLAEEAFKGQQTSLLGVVLPAASFVTTVYGNLPGPDTLSMALLKLQGVSAVLRDANNGAHARATRSKLTERLVKAVGFSADERTEFLGLVEKSRGETVVKGGGSAKPSPSQDKALKMLEAKYGSVQNNLRLNTGLTVLNLIQFLATLSSVDDFSKDAIKNAAALGSGAIQTATYAMATIGRAAQNISVPSLKANLGVLSEICVVYAKQIAGSIAVLSIVSAGYTLAEGISDGDIVKIAVGSLQVVSGMALTAGVLMGIPGAQPFGVIVGFVALAVSLADSFDDAIRVPTEKAMAGLVKSLKTTKGAGKPDDVIIERLGLKALVDEIGQLIETARNGQARNAFCKIECNPLGDHRKQYRELHHRVSMLGFGDSLATELVDYPGWALEARRFRKQEQHR